MGRVLKGKTLVLERPSRRFSVAREPQANHTTLPYYKRKPLVIKRGQKVVCRLSRYDLLDILASLTRKIDPQRWDV